jgi:hypothetical protein
MKKLFLTLFLMFSVANVTISIAYAAMCQGPGGARACGQTCSSQSNGECACTGECSKEERDWVGAAKGGDEELLEE